MRIAFTGPAIVENLHIERDHLVALAIERGHTVQKKVDSTTDLLVRSPEFAAKRYTVKARNSDQFGTNCITPAQFLEMMLV